MKHNVFRCLSCNSLVKEPLRICASCHREHAERARVKATQKPQWKEGDVINPARYGELEPIFLAGFCLEGSAGGRLYRNLGDLFRDGDRANSFHCNGLIQRNELVRDSHAVLPPYTLRKLPSTNDSG